MKLFFLLRAFRYKMVRYTTLSPEELKDIFHKVKSMEVGKEEKPSLKWKQGEVYEIGKSTTLCMTTHTFT